MSQLITSLSSYWNKIQGTLFPFLEEELDPLTTKQQQLIKILELVRIEESIPRSYAWKGRPQKGRRAIARAFVAKAVYNMGTTTVLIERLHSDKSLRRICGWESIKEIPSESTFSRAFAEFSDALLSQRVHEALIKKTLGEEIVLDNSRDSTAIEAREKPVAKQKEEPHDSIVQTSTTAKPKIKKKGRPPKGQEKPIQEPTRIEKQKNMTLTEMIADLPKECGKGGKKDSKGNTMYWTGYKLHLDVVCGCIPVSAIVTSASVHDSQVAIPLATITAQRTTVLYDLMDSAWGVTNR